MPCLCQGQRCVCCCVCLTQSLQRSGMKSRPFSLAGLAACFIAACTFPPRECSSTQEAWQLKACGQAAGQTRTSLAECRANLSLLPAEVYFLSDGPPVQWRSWLTQLIQTQGLKPPTATIPIWLAWIIAIILENLPFLDYSTRPAAPSDMRLTRQMLSLTGMQVTSLVLAVLSAVAAKGRDKLDVCAAFCAILEMPAIFLPALS